MKAALLALSLLSAIPAMAQTAPSVGQESAKPFKRANTVIIHAPDSISTAYKKLAQAFLQAGYTLDRADKELYFINTKAKPLGKMGVQETMQASLRPASEGTMIVLTGLFASPALAAISPLSSGDSKVEYKGMKGSALMACWEELERVASSYPGATIAYKQQP